MTVYEKIIKKEIFKSYDIVKTDKKYCHKLKYEIHGTYDRAGKILEEIHYDLNGSRARRKPLISKYVFKHEKGREVEMLYYLPLDRLFRKDKSFYDKNGRLMHSQNYFRGKLTNESYWKYDDKGNLEYAKVYIYNKKGQKIKEEHLHEKKVVGYSTYEYDEQRRLRVLKRYRSELEEMELRDYKYLKHGHKVFATSIRYKCDCTGVREIPYAYKVYELHYL